MDYLLKKGETLSLATGTNGYSLRMDRGTAWLTRYDDPRDYFLKPGETFAMSASRMVVVEALDDAVIALECVRTSKPSRAIIRIDLALPTPAIIELH